MNGKTNDVEILMFPGWGFSDRIWEIWDAFLEPDYTLVKYDPGYFGPVRKARFGGLHNRLNVVFAHSFGLHQLTAGLMKQTDLLVVFNGFIQFHPVAAQYRRRSKLVVQQMIYKLEDKPRQVLTDFLDNCYHPEPSFHSYNLSNLDTERLIHDLKRLNTEKLNLEVLSYVSDICVLHGGEDAIVPKAKGRELYDKMPVKGYYYEIQQAGHALPFTHTHTCWSFIKPIIEHFDR